MFFYFELFSIFVYFRSGRVIRSQVGDNPTGLVTITTDEIKHEYQASTITNSWSNISFVKETKRHILFKSHKRIIVHFIKKDLDDDTLDQIYRMLQHKKDNGLNVHYDWSKKR